MSRTQRGKGSLLKVEDKDVLRHSSLAYNDGYADAREYGQDGFWMPVEYNTATREAYMQGFKKGLRVWNVARANPEWSPVTLPVSVSDLLDAIDAKCPDGIPLHEIPSPYGDSVSLYQ